MTEFDAKKLLSVTDAAEYEQWRAECMVEDKCPCAAVFLLADSEMLFWKEEDAAKTLAAAANGRDMVQMPWLQRLRCELVSRPSDPDGRERRIKAAYIGFGTDDAPEFYAMFVEAMKCIGIYDCLQITAGDTKREPTKAQLAHLERADVVLIGGGDPWKTWTKMELTGVHEQVCWRYRKTRLIFTRLYGGCMVVLTTSSSLLRAGALAVLRGRLPDRGRQRRVDHRREGLPLRIALQGEKDAKLAQKLGQPQPFIAVFPQECMGRLAYFGPT